MKIGFYGSSLCKDFENIQAHRLEYQTYIQKLQKHYDANICHIGVGGCGVWDVILIQFKQLLENPPDVAVFVWPLNGVLFHREYRAIHKLSTVPGSRLCVADQPVWRATVEYYDKLFDWEKDVAEFKAALLYFDTMLLPQIKDKMKIIHLWEFGILTNFDDITSDTLDIRTSDFLKKFETPFNWSSGMQIDGPMIGISIAGQWPRRPTFTKVFKNDPRSNHIEGEIKNTLMFNLLSNAIDNYQNGVTIDKLNEIISFYDSYKTE